MLLMKKVDDISGRTEENIKRCDNPIEHFQILDQRLIILNQTKKL